MATVWEPLPSDNIQDGDPNHTADHNKLTKAVKQLQGHVPDGTADGEQLVWDHANGGWEAAMIPHAPTKVFHAADKTALDALQPKPAGVIGVALDTNAIYASDGMAWVPMTIADPSLLVSTDAGNALSAGSDGQLTATRAPVMFYGNGAWTDPGGALTAANNYGMPAGYWPSTQVPEPGDAYLNLSDNSVKEFN